MIVINAIHFGNGQINKLINSNVRLSPSPVSYHSNFTGINKGVTRAWHTLAVRFGAVNVNIIMKGLKTALIGVVTLIL